MATAGGGRDLKNIVSRYMSTCKRGVFKTDKDDPNTMVYMVIMLRARSGTRKEVPGEVVGLLWFGISHGML